MRPLQSHTPEARAKIAAANSAWVANPSKIEARNAEIRRRIMAGGVSLTDLGHEYGITTERVRQIAANGGMTGRGMKTHRVHWERKRAAGELIGPKMDAERAERCAARKAKREARLAEILRLRATGMTQYEIADALRTYATTVGQFLLKAGHRSRDMTNRNNPALRRAIVAMRATGATAGEVSAALRCSKEMVWRICRKSQAA